MTALLDVVSLALPGVKLIRPTFFMDERGYFGEVFQTSRFAAAGVDTVFVQDNQIYSEKRFTLRGLHYQSPPAAQAKLVRALRGRAYVVAVDIRRGSPSFGQHVGQEISAMGGEQLFIPAGFADGFLTLDPQTEMLFRVDQFYDPASERGVNWRDPALGIKWPVPLGQAVLSVRDVEELMLAEQPDLL
ncbi:MAG: dTDP-4-dehydrorhamnose 3,5-epimerase [Ferrovibrio sp.]|nr:dTDP-4-dehydrorhamnose 3,5-epimerase [Ferrovibrio sp.]